jgi:hypothetical protein
MKQLGEQWIEDGRMYKAVVGRQKYCLGCSKNDDSVVCRCKNIVGCEEGENFIIKDLGPVNKDGCLAEERTGLFPKFSTMAVGTSSKWMLSVKANGFLIAVYGSTRQEVINLWNQRAIK